MGSATAANPVSSVDGAPARQGLWLAVVVITGLNLRP